MNTATIEEGSDRHPTSAIDLFDEAVILDPYEAYQSLRDTGPAVWLSKTHAWAISRYEDVRQVLRQPDLFISGRGVAFNEAANGIFVGTTLTSDGTQHRLLRRTLQTPLMPAPMRELEPLLADAATRLIQSIPAGEDVDAVERVSRYLPLEIVSGLVGLPPSGRTKMLEWAAASFDMLGPPGSRTDGAGPIVSEMIAYAQTLDDPDALMGDSWGQKLFGWAERNRVPRDKVLGLLLDYIVPSLDTTINATSAALFYLGKNPLQWTQLRADPALIPRAIDEAIRLESPIRLFGRFAVKDANVGEVQIREGDRLVVLYASANRDERQWEEPKQFNLQRRNQNHLGFGHGEHACVGMPLARREITEILRATLNRFETLSVTSHEFGINQFLRGLKTLHMKFQ